MKSSELLGVLNDQIKHASKKNQKQIWTEKMPDQKSGMKMQIEKEQNNKKHAPNKQSNSIPSDQSANDTKSAKHRDSRSQMEIHKTRLSENNNKESKFEMDHIYEENDEVPDSLVQILSNQVGSVVTGPLSDLVQSVLKIRQRNVYMTYTEKDNSYLEALLENNRRKNQDSVNQISQILSKRYSKVQNQLENGDLIIQKDRNLTNRSQLSLLEQLDVARMIKIKDGHLRSKMDILKEKMNDFDHIQSYDGSENKELTDQMHKKIQENLNYINFSMDSQKTKIAKDYVKYMQHQRKLLQKNRQQRLKKSIQMQKQRQNQIKQAEQMRDLAKKQQILQKIEQNRKKRQAQQKFQIQKQEQIKKILEQYHKDMPLFRKKQKQFQEKILMPQLKFREEKLNEIKETKKSLSFSDMKTHEQKYLSRLSTQKIKREEQFKMIMNARKAADKQKTLFKGAMNERVKQLDRQQKMRSQSTREANKMKLSRISEYAKIIQKNFKPTVDEKKKNDLLKAIEEEDMKKKNMRKLYKQIVNQETNQIKLEPYYESLPKKNLYEEGNKFLEISKKHIKRKNPSLSQSLTVNSEKQIKNQEEKNVKLLRQSLEQSRLEKDKSIWQIRAKHLNQITNLEATDAKKFQMMKKSLEHMDNKALQKEETIKHIDLSIQEHIEQKGMLDQYYLQSIRNKIKLLE